jgi:hypothetical protein
MELLLKFFIEREHMYKKIITSMKVLTVATVCLIGFSTAAISGEEHYGAHKSHDWELGIGLGYTDLKTEGENGATLDLHLMKELEGDGLEKYFSVGFGAEVVLSHENHYVAMVVLAYHPTEHLELSIAPGLEWAKHDGTWEREYVTHYEAIYNFEIAEDYHIGPMIGYSKTKEAEDFIQ